MASPRCAARSSPPAVAAAALCLLALAVLAGSAAGADPVTGVTPDKEVAAMHAIRDALGVDAVQTWLPGWGDAGDICGPLGWAPEVMCDQTPDGNYTIVGISLSGAMRGTLSPLIADLDNLHHLKFYSVGLKKEGLVDTLLTLTQLDSLEIYNVALGITTDELDLSKFANLQSLTLRNVMLSGPVAKLNLPSLTNLQYLDLAQNQLTGELPKGLSNIAHIDLSSNQLSGVLPRDLISSPNVQDIVLYNNRLEGALPDVFAAAEKLQQLDLSQNKLVGSLPPSLAELPSLYYIDLSSNSFRGKMPRFFAACTVTNTSAFLNLTSNKLTGGIPNSLGLYANRNTVRLTVDLSSNQLQGAVPTSLLVADTFFYDHNDGLCDAPYLPMCGPDGKPVAADATDPTTAALLSLVQNRTAADDEPMPDGSTAADFTTPTPTQPTTPTTDTATPADADPAAEPAVVAKPAATAEPAAPAPQLTCNCEQLSAGVIFGIAFGAAVLAAVLVAAVVLTWLHYGNARAAARVEGAGFLFAHGEKVHGAVKDVENGAGRGEDPSAEVSREFPNGDSYRGQWGAAWDVPHGAGCYVWADGSVYEGEWARGEKHGQGLFVWPSGARYKGEWARGQMQGVGSYWGADGSFYTGNWAGGVKHGLGRKLYPNGDRYEGFWSFGAAHGPGRYVWANGNEYFGEWEGGTMSGCGTFTWASGERYEGEWEEGVEHGVGVFAWRDGSRYEGTWSRGLKDGKGVFYPAGCARGAGDAGERGEREAGTGEERDGDEGEEEEGEEAEEEEEEEEEEEGDVDGDGEGAEEEEDEEEGWGLEGEEKGEEMGGEAGQGGAVGNSAAAVAIINGCSPDDVDGALAAVAAPTAVAAASGASVAGASAGERAAAGQAAPGAMLLSKQAPDLSSGSFNAGSASSGSGRLARRGGAAAATGGGGGTGGVKGVQRLLQKRLTAGTRALEVALGPTGSVYLAADAVPAMPRPDSSSLGRGEGRPSAREGRPSAREGEGGVEKGAERREGGVEGREGVGVREEREREGREGVGVREEREREGREERVVIAMGGRSRGEGRGEKVEGEGSKGGGQASTGRAVIDADTWRPLIGSGAESSQWEGSSGEAAVVGGREAAGSGAERELEMGMVSGARGVREKADREPWENGADGGYHRFPPHPLTFATMPSPRAKPGGRPPPVPARSPLPPGRPPPPLPRSPLAAGRGPAAAANVGPAAFNSAGAAASSAAVAASSTASGASAVATGAGGAEGVRSPRAITRALTMGPVPGRGQQYAEGEARSGRDCGAQEAREEGGEMEVTSGEQSGEAAVLRSNGGGEGGACEVHGDGSEQMRAPPHSPRSHMHHHAPRGADGGVQEGGPGGGGGGGGGHGEGGVQGHGRAEGRRRGRGRGKGYSMGQVAAVEAVEDAVMVREYVHGMLVAQQPLSSHSHPPRWHVPRGREGKRAGELIYKGHRSYLLMRTLQLGLRYSVGRITPDAQRDVGPADFSHCPAVRFPPAGSPTTPPHSMHAFKWRDYCPAAFRALRAMFGIDPGDYMVSLCGDDALRELSSPGKSGSVFFLSHDDRFLIKTMRSSELQVLLRMLPAYYRHVKHNPHTLLTKFFGLHAIKIYHTASSRTTSRLAAKAGGRESVIRFVVMANLLVSPLRVHRRFDLKGSSQGRSTGKVAVDDTTTLKDLDLDLAFLLHPPWRPLLLQQIAADCAFLEQQHIMDYSLLLGVHFKATGPPPAPIVTITDAHLDGPSPVSVQPAAAPHGSSATAVSTMSAEREQGLVGQAGAAGGQSEVRDGGGGEDTQQPQQGQQAACESDAAAASRRLNVPPPLHQLRRRLFRPWQRILTDSPSPLQRSLGDPGRGGTSSSHTSPSHASPSHTSPSHASPSHTSPSYASPSHASSSHTSPSHTSPSHAGATAATTATTASPAAAATTRAATVRHFFPRSLTAGSGGSSPLHLLAPSFPHSHSLTTDESSVDEGSAEGSSSCGVVEGDGRACSDEEALGPADDRAARAATGTDGKSAGAAGAVVGQASPGEKTAGRGGGAVAAAAGRGGGGGGGKGRGVVGQLLGQGMGGTAVRVDRRTRRAVQDPLLGEAYEVLLHFGIIDILQEYDVGKRVEHMVKSVQYDGHSISAVHPSLYARRFRSFILSTFPDPLHPHASHPDAPDADAAHGNCTADGGAGDGDDGDADGDADDGDGGNGNGSDGDGGDDADGYGDFLLASPAGGVRATCSIFRLSHF
ncbi:unnamed protein product [Closterium sp. NIES-64]|nr:unnamed protein product [Closterium sp. NIES-64]